MTTPHIDRYEGCLPRGQSLAATVMSTEGAEPYPTPPDLSGLPPVDSYRKPQSGAELQQSLKTIIGDLASRHLCPPPIGNEALALPWRQQPRTFPTAAQLDGADWR